MPPVSYPDFGWSGRFSRLMRTLQVVAIAGTVGAVGGGVGVLAVMGLPGGSPRPQSAASNKAIAPAVGHATTTAQSASPAQPRSSVPPQSAPLQSNLAIAAQPQPAPQPQTTNESPRTNSVAVESTPPTSPPKASQAPSAQQQFATREHVVPEHGPAANAAQSDQRSHAAQDEHAVTKNLYDRAVPTASDEGSANQSTSSRSAATRKRTGKRVNRSAVAALPQTQYAPGQRDQYAPDAPPPMAIVPGRGYQTGWRAENADSSDWRDSRSGPYYARDAWRDRRPDDYDRGPPNPVAGFFGFLGGGDWH
jgi:hypothetical protein